MRRRIALFESRSRPTGNLASGHSYFTADLPVLERPEIPERTLNPPPRDPNMPESVASADIEHERGIEGEGEHEAEFAGDEYATPMWDNFQVKMNNVLAAAKIHLDAAEVTLGNNPDLPKFKALEGRISRLKSDFFHYTEAYHKITTEEYIENDANLYLDLQAIISRLEDMESVTSAGLSRLQPTPVKADNPEAATLAAFMKVANSPPVELPTYDGRNISEYAAFKEKFQFVIQYISGPKELWATHLENKLTHDAKMYVGSKGSWYNKYNELWEALDDKYANRWNIATEAVRNFFFKQRPEENQEAVLNWFHQQLDNLRNVISLNMSVEEIGTNLILQTLPNDYAREVRSGLRVAHASNKKKAAFSIKELRTVINDTIAIKHDPESFRPPKSTLSLQTAATPAGAGSALWAPESQHTPYQSIGRGRGRTRAGRSRGGSGRGRGRGNGARRPNGYSCELCIGEEKNSHTSRNCPNNPTPEAKREKFIAKNLCPACTQPRHTGFPCKIMNTCNKTPDCQSNKHYDWLCGGTLAPHPGIEA